MQDARSRWLRCTRPLAAPRLRLIAAPYAGGGATVYHRWTRELPEGVELRAVQLPARQERLSEPPARRVEDAVEAVLDALSSLPPAPVALYGHSFGALLAFELARGLRRRGEPPVALMVGARRAPQLSPRHPPIHHLPEAAFIDALHERWAVPRSLFDNRELRRIALPSLRGDLAASDRYRYLDEPPLEMPLWVLAGRQDASTRVDEIGAWSRHARGEHRERWCDGGHFFLDGQRGWVLDQVREMIHETCSTTSA